MRLRTQAVIGFATIKGPRWGTVFVLDERLQAAFGAINKGKSRGKQVSIKTDFNTSGTNRFVWR
jgi:hypothetical protein